MTQPDKPTRPSTDEVQEWLLNRSGGTLTPEQIDTAARDVLRVLMDVHDRRGIFGFSVDGKTWQQMAVNIPGLTDRPAP